jgi:hypothetical protein
MGLGLSCAEDVGSANAAYTRHSPLAGVISKGDAEWLSVQVSGSSPGRGLLFGVAWPTGLSLGPGTPLDSSGLLARTREAELADTREARGRWLPTFPFGRPRRQRPDGLFWWASRALTSRTAAGPGSAHG